MNGDVIELRKPAIAVAPSPDVSQQLDAVEADILELRRLGVELECAAATMTGAAQRVEAKQAGYTEFNIAEGQYEYARDAFREQLGAVTGRSAAWIERLLAL